MVIYLDSAKLDEGRQTAAQHIMVPLDLLTSLSNHPLSVQTVEQFNAEGAGIRSNHKELTWKRY
jgi:hypothetical protein